MLPSNTNISCFVNVVPLLCLNSCKTLKQLNFDLIWLWHDSLYFKNLFCCFVYFISCVTFVFMNKYNLSCVELVWFNDNLVQLMRPNCVDFSKTIVIQCKVRSYWPVNYQDQVLRASKLARSSFTSGNF